MITLHNISVRLGGTPILQHICATIEPGDFITIVGPNGSGKSTLFNLIAGTITPTCGSLAIDGIDVAAMEAHERAATIARLMQDPLKNCVATLSVRQNLALAHLKNRRAQLQPLHNIAIDIVVATLRTMMPDIDHLLDRPMGALSGGQRQMISFVMATVGKPKILLLDEPTAALDPQAATNLLVSSARFIKRHAITTLLITHDPLVALHLGNKLWIVRNGTIEQIDAQQKKTLSPDRLIGEIDYERLAALEAS